MGPPSSPDRPKSLLDVPDTYFDSAVVYWGDHSRISGENLVIDGVPHGLEGLSFTDGSEDKSLDKETVIVHDSDSSTTMNRWTCNACGSLDFTSLDDQRSHFKSDFHRLNVKRRLIGKQPVTEEEFDVLALGPCQEDDDMSSISGSDEEDNDSDKETSGRTRSSHISKLTSSNHISFLLQNFGEIVSIWKCVLLGDKEKLVREKGKSNLGSEECLTEEELLRRLKMFVASVDSAYKSIWVFLLSRGGHFAGCVVDARKGLILTHKTYHRYVVRAKAGGKQSSKDGSGRAPKSAGASLRRHNEAALQREVRDTLASWKSHLEAASCIFVHAPSTNSHALFGGEDAPLNRVDNRVRLVPLTTRRPTFKEAKRVFNELTALTHKKLECIEVSNGEESPTSGNERLSEGVSVSGAHQESDESPSCDGPLSNDTSSLLHKLEVTAGRGGNISSPLHDAAKSGDLDLVLNLLEKGGDPCFRDERGRTPYTIAVNKETRNVFRRFMAEHMGMWDWHAANVPSALTGELEAAQAAKQAEKEAKRKAKAKEQKKLRKAKQKVEAQTNSSKQVEAVASQLVCHGQMTALESSLNSKKNISSSVLKDAVKQAEAVEREKRASAAEKRIFSMTHGLETSLKNNESLSSSGTLGSCCSCCGVLLAGITPFYRFSYQYCSTACVHAHRVALEAD